MSLLVRISACALLVAGAATAQLRIPFWAYAADGAPRLRVAEKDVQAWVDEEAATVRGLRRPGDPLALLLVMDTVGDLNRVDAAREALGAHIESMGKEWNVALLQAQDGLRVVQDPTGNRRLLLEKLDGLSVSGFPGLLDSVSEAAGIAHGMLQRSKVRVAVLFITDGAIGAYRGDYTATVVNPSDSRDLSRRFGDRVIQEKIATLGGALKALTAPLFFVHLEERADSANVAYQNGVAQFAAATGGQAFFVRGVAEVAPLINQALEAISQHYVVSLDPGRKLAGSVKLRLEAGDSARLTYRPGLEFVETKKKKR